MSGPAGKPVPALLIATASCAVVVGAALALLPRLAGMLDGWSPAVIELLFTLLLFGTLAAIGWFGRRAAAVRDAARAPIDQAAVAGALTGFGGFLLAVALARLAGSVTPGGAALSAGAAAILIGTLSVAGQAAAEELFFRGWLQPVLVRGWGAAAGVAVTALVFSVLHMAGGVRSATALVNLAAGGVLFGLLALRSGGLVAPILAHAGWNWSEIVGLGLDPNPGVGSFGALRDLDLAGSAWWGGSEEGLNASVAMTIVLLALILPLGFGRGSWPFRSRLSRPEVSRTASRG